MQATRSPRTTSTKVSSRNNGTAISTVKRPSTALNLCSRHRSLVAAGTSSSPGSGMFKPLFFCFSLYLCLVFPVVCLFFFFYRLFYSLIPPARIWSLYRPVFFSLVRPDMFLPLCLSTFCLMYWSVIAATSFLSSSAPLVHAWPLTFVSFCFDVSHKYRHVHVSAAYYGYPRLVLFRSSRTETNALPHSHLLQEHHLVHPAGLH